MKAVCSLYDKVAQAYMQPFFVPALGIAFRNLSDEIVRGGEGNMLASHPGDFVLYQLATFDDETGEFICEGFPLKVCEVSSLVVTKD